MRRPLVLTVLLLVSGLASLSIASRQALAATATTITLASSANPSLLNQTVTFTATVTGGTEGAPVQISYNGDYIPLTSLHNGLPSVRLRSVAPANDSSHRHMPG
jgi:hypothetical protein